MRRIFFYLILSFLISFGVVAKTIDQKKEELKKIYEAGGISKLEFEKANNFLEEATKDEKKIKKSLSLKKDKKKKKSTLKKNKEPGSIVNIASTSSYVGQSFLTAYSTSKGGLLTLSKNTALALRKDKIRVNVVAPGWMNTPGEDEIQKKYHGASDDWVKKAEKTLPMGELVNPKKLAPLVCYLLSFSSGIITGSIINYDQQIVGAVPE